MLFVIAAIEVVPGKLQEFLPELRKIVPLVRADQGCLWYEPTVDVPTNISSRDRVRENVVTVVERWEIPSPLTVNITRLPHNGPLRPSMPRRVLPANADTGRIDVG